MDWEAVWKEGIIALLYTIYGDSNGYFIINDGVNFIRRISSFQDRYDLGVYIGDFFAGISKVAKRCSIPQLDVTFDIPAICAEGHLHTQHQRCTTQIEAAVKRQDEESMTSMHNRIFVLPLGDFLSQYNLKKNGEGFYPTLYCDVILPP